MDPQWIFVLDSQKKSLAESIYVVGNTAYSNVNIQANPPYQIIANTSTPFLDLTDTNTSYTLAAQDYMVQISSITYNSIVVPLALNQGGKKYYISNRSTQKIRIISVSTDTFDGASQITLKAGDHAILTSNNYNKWLVG